MKRRQPAAVFDRDAEASSRLCMCCGRAWGEHTEQEWRNGCTAPSPALAGRKEVSHVDPEFEF